VPTNYNQYIDPALLAILASRRLGLNEQAGSSRTRVGQDYASQQKELGVARQRGTTDLNDQFASRGLFSSGIRLNELGEFEQDISRQLSESTRGRDRAMQDIESALRAGLLGIQSEETQAGLEGYNAFLARQLAEQQSSAAMGFGGGGGGFGGDSFGGGGGGGRSGGGGRTDFRRSQSGRRANQRSGYYRPRVNYNNTLSGSVGDRPRYVPNPRSRTSSLRSNQSHYQASSSNPAASRAASRRYGRSSGRVRYA